MTFEQLGNALKRTGIPFTEGAWNNAEKLKSDYGVYALDGMETLKGDCLTAERIVEGTVDLFTRLDNGARQGRLIEDAMDGIGVAWRMNSIQYEDDTGLTHREWVFRCLP